MAGHELPDYEHHGSANVDTVTQHPINITEDVSKRNSKVEKEVDSNKIQDIEQNLQVGNTNISMDNDDKDLPSPDIQRGVQQLEAVTLVWTKKSLIIIFIK